jgi:hypothetical protein
MNAGRASFKRRPPGHFVAQIPVKPAALDRMFDQVVVQFLHHVYTKSTENWRLLVRMIN